MHEPGKKRNIYRGFFDLSISASRWLFLFILFGKWDIESEICLRVFHWLNGKDKRDQGADGIGNHRDISGWAGYPSPIRVTPIHAGSACNTAHTM